MGNMETLENLAGAIPEFSELYETHCASVYSTAIRVTGNPADAEDVLQTVFLRVLGTLAQGGKPPAAMKPEAWFRRAACNAAIDILRRKTARAEIPLDDMSMEPSRTTEALLKEQLRRAIATLAPEDAELFLMRYVEGFTNGDLADLFRQEKNNIAVRLHRIRQTLQIEMER